MILKYNQKKVMQILLKQLTGKIISLEMTSDQTIEEGKILIQEKEGFPSQQQRWIYAGKALADSKTIGHCNIQRNSFIHLVLNLRGGGMSFADCETGKEYRLVKEGPNFQSIDIGLNIQCRCQNQHCRSKEYGNLVYIRLGMGTFDLPALQKDFECCACKGLAKMITCGFFDCGYRLDGQLSNQDQRKVHKEGTIGKDKYFEYDGQRQVEWESLTIETFKTSQLNLKEEFAIKKTF